MYLITDIY